MAAPSKANVHDLRAGQWCPTIPSTTPRAALWSNCASCLRVKIIRGREIKSTVLAGSTDPYVTLNLLPNGKDWQPRREKVGWRTKISAVGGDTAPLWHETAFLALPHPSESVPLQQQPSQNGPETMFSRDCHVLILQVRSGTIPEQDSAGVMGHHMINFIKLTGRKKELQ